MALGIISKSIRNKLLAITGISTALVVSVALAGFWQAWSSVNQFDSINDGAINNERTVLVMTTEFKKQVQEWKDTLLRGSDPAKLEKYWGLFQKQEAKIQALGSKLQGRLENQEAKALVTEFINAHKSMGVAYRKGLDAYKSSNFDSHAGDKAVAGIDREPTRLLEKASKLISEMSSHEINASLTAEQGVIMKSIIGILVMVVVATLAFIVFIQKSIVSPSRQLRADLARMAEGNFTQAITSHSQDEIGQVAASAQHLQQQLSHTIGSMSSASQQLANSSSQLTGIVEHTSHNVMQQRQQTEMVATAMNEMVATVQEVSHNANRAADSAMQANDEASNGMQVLGNTTEAIDTLATDVEKAAQVIHKLEEHSNAIGSVLDVIRDIAEQTNLLALNAAIEAARAGEQGRGFAVVADEVRTLAQRTQQSTSEIQNMIEQLQAGTREAVTVMADSRERAGDTVNQAKQAGVALETIVAAISAISDMNTQIATAAEEQSAVAEEIGRNITAISQAAEQSAESSGQTAQSSEELAQLANELQVVASRFQV